MIDPSHRLEIELGDHGGVANVGLPPNTEGAVQVIALCRQKVDGGLAHAGQTYWLERARADFAAARNFVHIMTDAQWDWWTANGRVLSPFEGDREEVFAAAPSDGSLTIVQGCGYDPGSAAYRTHSAINAATKHVSAFVRFGDTNPHCSLRQLDGLRDAPLVRDALLSADVLHCHINYLLAANADARLMASGDTGSVSRPIHWRRGQWVVRHYHGSHPSGTTLLEHTVDAAVRDRLAANGGDLIRVGARLSLCAERGAEDLRWLPIPMPVARYRALRAANSTPGAPFRVAHSPTKRQYKGTDKFMAAINGLKRKGLGVEAVLIENRDHGTALRMKAGCDAVFDSLWLGLQGSGLEGGAMGIPCIAGDGDVAALYKQHIGHVPYTFAGDEHGIALAIERLATDAAFYAQEAKRLSEYVVRYHDYPAVAKCYETILADAMGREDIRTTARETDSRAVATQAEQTRSDSPSPRKRRGRAA
jgi:hypothetical protein